ncbi:MAG: ROK family transcriptional regulator [Agrococcus casei]|uniref:Putative ROK-family transcriptional regulator n=1 Tax=Agrococcus casei LMG 22410 TaxID=1255656 RepID=A0A1R4GH73_9MICO|nr:ROK family transcriptional regulator [Agrococcus casei]SJM67292.1 Putative ROK-family transcriptional regulator [Agrococcus casei LMG 22410]
MQRGHRRPGSTAALRVSNERAILRDLLSNGPATQSELARRTRLSNGSVSSIVKALRGRGMLETSSTVASGRRATLVTPRTASRTVAVGIDLGRSHIGIAVLKPGRELLLEKRVAMTPETPAEQALADVRQLLHASLGELERTTDDIAGIVFGVPGPVDRERGVVVDGTILPEWVGRSADDVSTALGIRVELANDADVGALAERAWGSGSEIDDFLFVKIGTGIGAGIVADGHLYTGGFGIAGEIGHSTVDPTGALCRCGNRGCLETVAATPVILQYLSEAFGRSVSRSELGELASTRHRATMRVVQDAGQALGQSIASAVNILGSKLVIIGGPLSETGDVLLDPVREGFARFAIPSVAERTRVELSRLGEAGSARGAASLAFDRADESAYLIDDADNILLSDVDNNSSAS